MFYVLLLFCCYIKSLNLVVFNSNFEIKIFFKSVSLYLLLTSQNKLVTIILPGDGNFGVFFAFLAGVLEKTCFYSNGSEGLTVNGDFERSDDLLPNMVENSSKTDPTVDLSTQPSSWTTTSLSHMDQMNKNSNIFRESFQEHSFAPPTQATVLNHQPAYDAALAEGSEDDTRLFATAEEVTLWSTDASFNNTERMTTLPVLSPTHPSVSQKMDQKKSKFIFYLAP